jgi:hypothetical protein
MPEHVSCLNSFCCNLLLASMRSMRGSFYTRGRVEIGCVNGEQMIKPVVEGGLQGYAEGVPHFREARACLMTQKGVVSKLKVLSSQPSPG